MYESGGVWPHLWSWRSEPVDVAKLRAERDALSQLLRGMARRLRNYRRLSVTCPECGWGAPFRFYGEDESVTECRAGCGTWPTDQRRLSFTSERLAELIDLIGAALGLQPKSGFSVLIDEAERLRAENERLNTLVAEYKSRVTMGGPARKPNASSWENRSSRPPTAPPEEMS